MNLYQIDAPHFCAGFCLDGKGIVWQAAPIIKWLIDKPLFFVESYCKKKEWSIRPVPESLEKETKSV